MASSSSNRHQFDPDRVYNLFLGYKADEILDYLESFPRAERFGEIKCMAERLQADLESGFDIDEDKHLRDADEILELAQAVVDAPPPPPPPRFPAGGTKFWFNIWSESDRIVSIGMSLALRLFAVVSFRSFAVGFCGAKKTDYCWNFFMLLISISWTGREWFDHTIAIGLEVPAITSSIIVAAPELVVGQDLNDEAAGPEPNAGAVGPVPVMQNPEAAEPAQHELLLNDEVIAHDPNDEAVGPEQNAGAVGPIVPVMQNPEGIDLEGNIPEAVQEVIYVFRVNVHVVMADDGLTGYAGMPCNVGGQYVNACCRSVPGVNLATVFASACALFVRVGYIYAAAEEVPRNTVLVILESDQLYFLQILGFSPEVLQLRHELSHTRNRLSEVSHEENSAVVQLAEYAREIRIEGVLLGPDLPDWASDLFGGFG